MTSEGYAAPDHITKGLAFKYWLLLPGLSTKCDVYSYGVVLLELLTGRRAIDNSRANAERQLVDWAKPYLRNRKKLLRIMDTKLEGKYPREAAFEVATLALECINFEPKTRPKMSEVLGKIEKLQDPKL
ncbi:putative serine/threonine-protein kinase PBL3 [Bienertia sinuspersici]